MTSRAIQSRVDVRAMPARMRQPAVFSTFAALRTGETMALVNDRDPQPLQARFEAELPDAFAWTYLERGPAVWRVAISKLPRPRAGTCCGAGGGPRDR